MAKKSAVQKNNNRRVLIAKFEQKRTQFKEIIKDKNISAEDRFNAMIKLAKLPRNSVPGRYRNRCWLTGRPRGYYRKMGISRIAMRELGSKGVIPGLVKSSW